MNFIRTLFLLAILWNNGSLESADNVMIMINNDTNIICAAKEITNSAIFIKPPLYEITDSINLLEDDWWKDDNWTKKSSEDSYHEAVLDKRWEDFSLNFTNKMVFLGFKSITLSIYGSVEVSFFSSDEEFSYNYTKTINVDSQWTTFVYFVKNENIYILQNNKRVHSSEEVGDINNLTIITNKYTYFKIHKYSFIESTIPSTKTTFLRIPENNNTYLILYISLCSWCKLEISSNNKNYTIISTAKDNDLLQKWQTYKLDTDLMKGITLEFNKTVNGNQTEGYWSLDFKLYRNKHQITTFKYNKSHLYPEEYKCEFLLSDTLANDHTVIFEKCESEEFGGKCAINCENIFGEALFNHDGYEICKNISDLRISELNYGAKTVVLLKNETNIICATKELTNSALFIHPPLHEVSDSINLLESDWWKNDNWTTKSSEDSFHEAVLDKRWEDFSLNFTNKMVFLQLKSTVFSIYGSVEVSFLSRDEEFYYNYTKTINVDSGWTTFVYLVKNENIYILQNNKRVYAFKEVGNIQNLTVTTNKETYFKIQKYCFIESTTPSTKNTYLRIPENERTYLILYISLCSWCKLEISSNNKNYTIISTAKDNDFLKTWQIYNLDIDLMKGVTLEFNKTVTGNQIDGYWSLDLKLYKNKYHITTYKYDEFHLYPEEFKCGFLLNDTLKNVNALILKKCKPGELGSRCAFHSKDIFGEVFPTCYGYKICENVSDSQSLDQNNKISEQNNKISDQKDRMSEQNDKISDVNYATTTEKQQIDHRWTIDNKDCLIDCPILYILVLPICSSVIVIVLIFVLTYKYRAT